MMTKEDYDDIRRRMPFVLTSDEIPEYNILYVGKQREDELGTYVFDVAPKQIEKNRRYFQGRIWVDDHDFQIVKTYGKNVPDLGTKKRGGQENLFPNFTTWRQQIDNKYWFPVYTKVDDTLHFSTGDIHIRQIVKYTDYKRFGSNVKITYDGQEVAEGPAAERVTAGARPGPAPGPAEEIAVRPVRRSVILLRLCNLRWEKSLLDPGRSRWFSGEDADPSTPSPCRTTTLVTRAFFNTVVNCTPDGNGS